MSAVAEMVARALSDPEQHSYDEAYKRIVARVGTHMAQVVREELARPGARLLTVQAAVTGVSAGVCAGLMHDYCPDGIGGKGNVRYVSAAWAGMAERVMRDILNNMSE